MERFTNEVVIITVSYNNAKVILEYVENIEQLCEDKKRIIVVDNNSVEEEKIKLRDLANENRIIFIENKENVGYFKGLNVGIEYVKKNNIKFKEIIIGNNDIEYSSNFFEKLREIKYDSEVFVIAPNIITKDGFHQNPHVINRISKKRKMFYDLYYSNYYIANSLMYTYKNILKKSRITGLEDNEEKNIYMGIGALYILTNNFFENNYKLDDNVFLWGEEALLGNQVEKSGGKIRYIPELKLKHFESVATGKLNGIKKYKIMKKSYKIYRDFL